MVRNVLPTRGPDESSQMIVIMVAQQAGILFFLFFEWFGFNLFNFIEK